MQKIIPFLLFEGKAEEAMNFYLSVFEHGSIKHVTRYGKEGPGPEGSIVHAIFSLGDLEFMCIDSPVHHAFTFTPALSLYVNCSGKEEVNKLFSKLSEDGKVLMPLDKYPFSECYGWINDKYGVSWQLSLQE